MAPCAGASLPLELVLFVPDVVSFVVAEQLGDAARQVAVDAVHVAGRGHDGAHVFVAVLDALLHLNMGQRHGAVMNPFTARRVHNNDTTTVTMTRSIDHLFHREFIQLAMK